MVPLSAAESLGMWIMGGVFERFRGSRSCSSSPARLGVVVAVRRRRPRGAAGLRVPAITALPSHYFHQNVFLTFVDEPDALEQARGRLGLENVLWSSDYPHPVTSFPNSKAIVDAMFAEADPANAS